MHGHLQRALVATGEPSILVLGDLILDRYIMGDVQRVSPEAPIPVLRVKSDNDLRLGGAANVALNLAVLGARVSLLGVAGRDAAGADLRRRLRASRIEAGGVIVERGRPTTEKTRLIAHNQQIVRVDREVTAPIRAETAEALLRAFRDRLSRADLVVVSDYHKGVLPPALLEEVVRRARARRVPVLVDPKGRDYRRYRGATAITPNQGEAELASGVEIRDDAGLRRAARKLLRELALDFVVVTRGEKGMYLLESTGRSLAVPARARSVYDVTGAGDTAIALLGLVLAGGGGREEAVRLSNVAAGIVVGKLGTATLTRAEILDELAEYEGGRGAAKIKSLAQLLPILRRHRAEKDEVVFTNGCFDLLHPGHLRSINFARSRGDVLVVGVNSDRSVRKLKGPGRPLLRERDRALMLANLEDVDYVTVFDAPTPAALIRAVAPDVLVKGEEYRGKEVVGADDVCARGGRVEYAPLEPGFSTTELLERAGRPKPGRSR